MEFYPPKCLGVAIGVPLATETLTSLNRSVITSTEGVLMENSLGWVGGCRPVYCGLVGVDRYCGLVGVDQYCGLVGADQYCGLVDVDQYCGYMGADHYCWLVGVDQYCWLVGVQIITACWLVSVWQVCCLKPEPHDRPKLRICSEIPNFTPSDK